MTRIHSVLRSAAACGAILVSACEGEPTAHDDVTPPDPSALLGTSSGDDSCRPHDMVYFQKVMHYGRTIANTQAFEGCVDQAMRNGINGIGPYMRCKGDAFYDADMGNQVRLAIVAARSPNDVKMECGFEGSEQAHAQVGSWGHGGDEVFTWTNWSVAEAFDKLEEPLCGANPQPCRWAPEPWPWAGMADTVWHEAMHTQGYVHGNSGAADPEQVRIDNRAQCGWPVDSAFDYQVNTIPYIIGNCIAEVANRSAAVCGLPIEQHERKPVAGLARDEVSLNLIDGFDSKTCQVVGDSNVDWFELLPVQKKLVTILPDTNIWGGDYRSFDLADKAHFQGCYEACVADAKCAAYSYVPGEQGTLPKCWLKNDFYAEPSNAPGLVSGYWQVQ